MAADGRAGIQLATEVSPGLVILDLSLPDIDGLQVCRTLRGWYQGPILILSAAGEEQTIVRALDLGADDYLTKPFRQAELLARIRALERRYAEGAETQNIIRSGPLMIDRARRRLFRGEEEIRLTRTEFDLLVCLALHPDRVVTFTKLLEDVWGGTQVDYTQTIRVHIGHLRKKIEADSHQPRYIITEPGVGYRFVINPEIPDLMADEAGAD